MYDEINGVKTTKKLPCVQVFTKDMLKKDVTIEMFKYITTTKSYLNRGHLENLKCLVIRAQ